MTGVSCCWHNYRGTTGAVKRANPCQTQNSLPNIIKEMDARPALGWMHWNKAVQSVSLHSCSHKHVPCFLLFYSRPKVNDMSYGLVPFFGSSALYSVCFLLSDLIFMIQAVQHSAACVFGHLPMSQPLCLHACLSLCAVFAGACASSYSG